MKKIPNIATAGDRCFCPGCVRELPLDNTGCPHCGFVMDFGDHIWIPRLSDLIEMESNLEDVSPKFFKFLIAYGTASATPAKGLPMTPIDIQTIVLKHMAGRYYRLSAEETYLLSGEPDESNEFAVDPHQSAFICKARMDREAFFEFRKLCNSSGVWIVAAYTAVENHDGVYDYEIIATEKW